MPTLSYKSEKGRKPDRGDGSRSDKGFARKPAEPMATTGDPSGSAQKKPFLSDPKIKRQHVLFFTRQLFTLHKAGVPISDALAMIASHERHPGLRKVIVSMKKHVEEGGSLTSAMRRHPKIFSVFYTGVVEGGEQNGVLSPLLDQLVHYMENEETLNKNIRSALRYPTFVMITMAVAFLVIMTFIFPRFEPMFSKFGDDLPVQTKVLLSISSVLQHQWYLLLGGTVLLIAAFLFVKRFDAVRSFLDRMKFRLPIFGKFYRYTCISKFANMISTFFSGGIVDYLNILDLIKKSFRNVMVKDEVRRLSYEISNGRGLGESMESSRLFPPLFAHLTQVGEKTGEIQSMMKILYDYYEEELRYKTKKLIGNIEPLILLVTSGFVVIIALGIFMPYWRMMDICK